MSINSVESPFPIFTDVDGNPLESGYIYIGEANQNPEVVSVAAYWDSSLTTPAAQPIRTIGGYPSRAGTAAKLYVQGDYSISVRDKNNSLVFSSPVATDILISINSLTTISELIGYTSAPDNTTVDVLGYDSVNDGGGDLFNWDSTIDKSTANGGTIVDPSVSLVNQGTGVGTGCWARQYSGTTLPEYFGVPVTQTEVDSAITVEKAKGNTFVSSTIDVLIPTDYATLQGAFDTVAKWQSDYKINLVIESGFAPLAGVLCADGDYSNISISSIDAEVTVGVGYTGSFIEATNASAPYLKCLINANGLGADGVNIRNSSKGVIANGCGVKNAYDRGLYVGSASHVSGEYSIWSGSGAIGGFHGRALWVTRSSSADLEGANFDNCLATSGPAVYISRNSTVHMSDCSILNPADSGIFVQRASRVNIHESTIDGSGTYAIGIARGATVIANDSDLTNCTGVGVDCNNSSFYANAVNITSNVSTEEAVLSKGGIIDISNATIPAWEGIYIIRAEQNSNINAVLSVISGATSHAITMTGSKLDISSASIENSGSIGIFANNGSFVNASSLTVTNAGGQGVRADGGSKLNVVNASVTGSATEDIMISTGSLISASGCTTTNGVGTPTIADTNIVAFNTLYSDGIIFS